MPEFTSSKMAAISKLLYGTLEIFKFIGKHNSCKYVRPQHY